MTAFGARGSPLLEPCYPSQVAGGALLPPTPLAPHSEQNCPQSVLAFPPREQARGKTVPHLPQNFLSRTSTHTAKSRVPNLPRPNPMWWDCVSQGIGCHGVIVDHESQERDRCMVFARGSEASSNLLCPADARAAGVCCARDTVRTLGPSKITALAV